MKKIIIVLAMGVCLQTAYAQRPVAMELPDRLYQQGREMYLNGNYTGCIDLLNSYKKSGQNNDKITEANFMILSSEFNQGKSGIEALLKNYLSDNPATDHRCEIAHYIGVIHFDEKEWDKAIFWFSQADLDYLSPKDQENQSYRYAYCCLETGRKAEAERLFGLLMKNSAKYRKQSTYYYAYILFDNQKYKQAIPLFQLLKKDSEFSERAAYYLTESKFASDQLDGTIQDGEKFLSDYPNSQYAPEVSRVLGNAYYHKGNLNKAIPHYEQYKQATDKPLREDMYMLANAYYKTIRYADAANAAQYVASTGDLLGQAGYLLLGQSNLKVNNFNNAAMAFDAAARLTFDKKISEEALYNYVMLINRSALTAFGQAADAFKRFLTQYPNSRYQENVNRALASTLLSCKNYQTAISLIDQIPSPGLELMEAKQTILYQWGVQNYIDQKYDDASKLFNQALHLGNYNKTIINECHYWMGQLAYLHSDYLQASDQYTRYIAKNTTQSRNYTQALYNLGYARFELKDYKNAANQFGRFIEMAPDHSDASYQDALMRLGDCSLYNRDYATAENYYGKAMSIRKSSADYAAFQHAFVLGLRKQYQQKIAAIDQMLATYPNSAYYNSALFEKSRAWVMLNQNDKAIGTLNQLLGRKPPVNIAQKAGVQLGQLYFNSNQTPKAIEAYKNVISLSSSTEEGRIAIQSLEAAYKDIDDIKSYAQYVNSLGKGHSISASREDSLTYRAAENIYMKGRKGEAFQAFTSYANEYPQGMFNSDAHFYIGSIAYDNKNFDKALEQFKIVTQAGTSKYTEEALILTSGIEFDRKLYNEALQDYKQLVANASNDKNKQLGLMGVMHTAYLLKNDQEVIGAADELIAKAAADDMQEAYLYRGKAYQHTSNYVKAMADFKQAADNARTAFGAEATYRIAEVYYQTHAYDQSEKQVFAFMKAGTSHEYWMARAFITLSDVYQAQGKNFQAREYLENLKANYKGKEQDIQDMISQRLSVLQKKSAQETPAKTQGTANQMK